MSRFVFKPNKTHLWEIRDYDLEDWRYRDCIDCTNLFFYGPWKGVENTECFPANLNHKGCAGLARQMVVQYIYRKDIDGLKYWQYRYCHAEQYDYLRNVGRDLQGKEPRNWRLEEIWEAKKKKLGIDKDNPGIVW